MSQDEPVQDTGTLPNPASPDHLCDNVNVQEELVTTTRDIPNPASPNHLSDNDNLQEALITATEKFSNPQVENERTGMGKEVEKKKCPLTLSMGFCRICHGGTHSSLNLGPLAAPCDCKGTVEQVHISCLERWLKESGTDSCELCGYRFQVLRVPSQNVYQSFLTWVSTEMDAKQLVLDFLWFCVMTPLALFAAYMILFSTEWLITMRLEDNPCAMVSLLMLSLLVLVAYYSWVATVFRSHASSWLDWRRSNFEVRLLIQRPRS